MIHTIRMPSEANRENDPADDRDNPEDDLNRNGRDAEKYALP